MIDKNIKISCKDCKRTCCDNMFIKKGNRQYGTKLKSGSLLYIKGIIWKKKKNGLWKCIAFDSKKKLCKIWEYRPPLCRYYFCQFAKNIKRKRLVNQREYNKEIKNSKYRLLLKSSSHDLLKGNILDYNKTKIIKERR